MQVVVTGVMVMGVLGREPQRETLAAASRSVETKGCPFEVDGESLRRWVRNELEVVIDKIEEVLTCDERTGG